MRNYGPKDPEARAAWEAKIAAVRAANLANPPQRRPGDQICDDPRCEGVSHIEFRCANHPQKRWWTKNIPGRSFFYNLFMDPSMGRECDCSGSALEHIHEGSEDSTPRRENA